MTCAALVEHPPDFQLVDFEGARLPPLLDHADHELAQGFSRDQVHHLLPESAEGPLLHRGRAGGRLARDLAVPAVGPDAELRAVAAAGGAENHVRGEWKRFI